MKLTRVGEGFASPVLVTSSPGDTTRLYVVEKTGLIRILKPGGTVASRPFLDVTSRLNIPASNAEGGLLGLAFAPDYATSGRFFIHHSVMASDGKPARVSIAEYKRSATDPEQADPASLKELIWVRHGAWNHVGGSVAFGKDGHLYVGVGDEALAPSQSGDPNSRLGKIWRIDINQPMVAPAGNLSGGDPFVWDYGLRNPWRFSFDREDGTLYIGDVGLRTAEEINVEAAGTGKRNYGWPMFEGACTSCGSTTPPALSLGRNDAGSVIGGYVYRGRKLPCLRGRYIFGDYETSKFFSFVWDGSKVTAQSELTGMLNPAGSIISRVSSFGEDADGELYVVAFTTGRIYRIDPM